MGYTGGKIASLFRPEPTRAAVHEMARVGGDRLHDLVVLNTPIDTGNLRTSWRRTRPISRVYGPYRGWTVQVATDVAYAAHVEWGTGLWGPNGAKYEITPKQPGGVLRWVGKGGQEVFAKRVMHPGSPGAHMMAIAVGALEIELEGDLFDDVLDRWKRDQEAMAD